MQAFVNDRPLGELAAGRASVGELVEALGVHLDPGEVLISVALDDEVFSAGDEARYSRRSAAQVSRLTLHTSTVTALAARLRADARDALASITSRLRGVTDDLEHGRIADGQRGLATALDELRLVLLLDQHTLQLEQGRALTSQDDLAPVAESLLAAQHRGDRAATRTLLRERLLPLLEGWSAASAPALDAPSEGAG